MRRRTVAERWERMRELTLKRKPPDFRWPKVALNAEEKEAAPAVAEGNRLDPIDELLEALPDAI